MELVTRQLSDRERTVLLLAADGLTDKEIAKHLHLSQRTIGTYWERMRDKLGHYSRTQLVARFVRGVVESDESASYKSLFSSWDEGVWIILPDGHTLYANSRIAELFGMDPGDFQRANAKELIEKASSASMAKLFEGAGLRDQNIEFRIEKPDGVTVWVSMVASQVSNGKPGNSALVLRLSDVTVQKRVKHTLTSCESSLTFLSEHSTDFIVRFDENLTCTSVNPSFQSFIGKDLVGSRVPELTQVFVPNDRWVKYIDLALKSGETQKFGCRCPGLVEDVETYLLPLPTEDQRTVSVISLTAIKWSGKS